MSGEREPIGVIGTGYVGLVTAAGFAELGNDVWCIDIDADKIARLKRGEIPIYEPGLEDLVAKHRERLHFSTDIADALEHARLLFVAVGTPPTYSGDADLSAVHAVVGAMPPSDGHALIMKSTVPVGTGASIKRIFREQGKDDFRYVSCPEFLKEGSAVRDFLEPDRVVVGDDGDWAGEAVVELYAPLGAPLVRTDIASAEMIKLAANAFLATKISFINEIANVCEVTGANVIEVAKGIGLDDRIGPKFLQAGVGFGGSCLAGEETVLVRHHGRTTLLRLEDLWRRLEREDGPDEDGVIEPLSLEVLSWAPDQAEPLFLPVMCATRRDFVGELVEVRTKMGRRVRCTPDHPWLVSDGEGGEVEVKLAEDLTSEDWLPLAMERTADLAPVGVSSLLSAAEAAEIAPDKLIVRPRREHIDALSVAGRRGHEIRRTGTLRFHEAAAADVPLRGSTLRVGRSNEVPSELTLDAAFWRVVGLYIAEGNAFLPRYLLQWTFHHEKEQHLVDEVCAFWLRHRVVARARPTPTAATVQINSRLLHAWWTQVLGMGRTGYEQRLPDLIWDRPLEHKWALLSGLFEGDGSWSLINGGPSCVIELGTVSDELADGVMRLLAEVGVVASRRIGRTAKSTKDTHWIRISGAEQIEKAIVLVPERDRPGVLASVARQAKRIAPTGYRRFDDGAAWVRVVGTERQPFAGSVYSFEVPGVHTFVTTGGIALKNCFPKDVTALKQLAGNSGYHFQLLNAVIEVNELQKRRVMAKLEKHLGSLVGKSVALLGLAFKPNTDDMREATSLVLSARLQAAGANVRAYDPIAEDEARHLMPGLTFADDTISAVSGADATVLVTEWDEFKTMDLHAVAEAMAGDVLIDGRNALDPEAVRAAGLTYEGIGRS
jgi:UDPglucose 6-dehydrogenase